MDMLLQDYSEKTGRTLLQQPNIPKANITLEGQTQLTLDEYLQAMDSVLAMNGVALLKVGDKFLKVVLIATALQEEMEFRDESQGPPPIRPELVSQMIQLQYITTAEAQLAIAPLKHSVYAQITLFDRINSILLTDTSANVNRIMQILKYIDQPTEAKEEPNIIEIHYANAADIKKKLDDVIADQQKDAAQSTVPRMRNAGSPGVVTTPTVPGVIRAAPATTRTQSQPDEAITEAEKGIILGKVKIIADDRTNILIIITRHENMVGFFDKIIKVLDVPTAPDVTVKVIRLQYANAEKTAATLNTLIGGKAADKSKDAAAKPGAPGEQGKSTSLNDYVQKLENPVTSATTANLKSKVGELSASNIKILADDRTNALLLMASKGDMAALEEMVKDMDIMLSQVMIEVVIFKVNLVNQNERGVDMIQRALVAYEQGANGTKNAKVAFAGVAGGGNNRSQMQDPMTLTSLNGLSSTSGNLTYYFTFFDLNLDAIIQLIESNNKTQILSSPQILTTDNEPSTINVTSQKYFFNGLKPVTAANGSTEYIDDVITKAVGTKLTVTPHINEKKFVVMKIEQTLDEEGAGQTVQGAGGPAVWPTIDSSSITANVAVRSGETIVLGGLVGNTKTKNVSEVPLLGDIPIIGMLFKHTLDTFEKDETIVFITPYVLNTPEEMEVETARIRNSVDVEGMWPKGWSRSKLADDTKHDYATKREERRLAEHAEKESKRADVERDAAFRTNAIPMDAHMEKKQGGDEKTELTGKEQQSIEQTSAPVGSVKDTPARNESIQSVSAEQVDTDPATEQFIERQEKRWDKEVKDVDQTTVKDQSESGNK
jgi:general secretion pathway protein D